ncbi:aspartyl-tRNA(Asn) amidotransferase subunit A [Halalkalibacter wakoensis JCM 9140]|uniref:Aspartyl-tRNA(Asn) amidotransferase subunit A n=1 Tax=Halalkalibacter wakoensis JCM 9140 TaxID=1236970 RepID=W4Q2C2_9BACI|nr:amidase family protein [Halalkalibacter wakoensis]GAE26137.1 aspartyl-tRNA(Asn) amidotransferase subunit A [Halalkalibacter wakoensis JCM 9140]
MVNPKLREIESDWFLQADIDDLQEKLENGEVTSKELVLLYLERIAKIDQSGPTLNSVVEVNPDALHMAEVLDQERKTGKGRGHLHGIPILLKDNIDTKDKLHTSAGSLALANHYASEDAFLVRQLRKAGAIILGKTNMSEWAYFMSTENMPSGYSSRGGQVKNPYGVGKFEIGGSSSGSGAAIAAHLASAAIGTETSGSILSPSSQNSLVGIKPTVGLVSRHGIIPISHTQDTAGPMTRSVKDAAYVLAAIMGEDEHDIVTKKNPLTQEMILNALEDPSLEGVRMGVVREPYFQDLPEEKGTILNNAIQKFQENGATIIEDATIPSVKENFTIDVLVYEFKANLNAYLQGVSPNLPVHTLNDVIRFNQEDPERRLKYGQSLLTKSEQTSGTLTEAAYLEALQFDQYHSKENGIDAALAQHDLDLLIFPNNLGAGIPAKAGYPSITVPAGYTEEGEPVGITFTSKAFTEHKLIKVAAAFEKIEKVRVNPSF